MKNTVSASCCLLRGSCSASSVSSLSPHHRRKSASVETFLCDQRNQKDKFLALFPDAAADWLYISIC